MSSDAYEILEKAVQQEKRLNIFKVSLEEATLLVSSDIPVQDRVLVMLFNEYSDEPDLIEAFLTRASIPYDVYSEMLMGSYLSDRQLLSYSRRVNLSCDEVACLLENVSQYMRSKVVDVLVRTAGQVGSVSSDMWFMLAGDEGLTSLQSKKVMAELSRGVSVHDVRQYLSDDLKENHKYYELFDFNDFEGCSSNAVKAVSILSSTVHTDENVVRFISNSPVYRFRMLSCMSPHVSSERVGAVFADAFTYFLDGVIDESFFENSVYLCLKSSQLTVDSILYAFQFLDGSNARSFMVDEAKHILSGYVDEGLFDVFAGELCGDESLGSYPSDWLRRLLKVKYGLRV